MSISAPDVLIGNLRWVIILHLLKTSWKLRFILRNNAHVPLSSPPRPKKLVYTFETSCGLIQEQSFTYMVFLLNQIMPHLLFSLLTIVLLTRRMRKSLCSSFAGLGSYTFPCRFKSKDYEIHDSSIGKTAPVCDNFFLQLLEVKPIDRLWLSQSLWAKPKNLLRIASNVLGTT